MAQENQSSADNPTVQIWRKELNINRFIDVGTYYTRD